MKNVASRMHYTHSVGEICPAKLTIDGGPLTMLLAVRRLLSTIRSWFFY